MEENSSFSEHILKMSGYHNHLSQLGIDLPVESVIDRVLQSLPPSYKGFVMNYNVQGMTKNDCRAVCDAEIGRGRNHEGAASEDG